MSANNTNRILQETGVEDASTDALSLSQKVPTRESVGRKIDLRLDEVR